MNCQYHAESGQTGNEFPQFEKSKGLLLTARLLQKQYQTKVTE